MRSIGLFFIYIISVILLINGYVIGDTIKQGAYEWTGMFIVFEGIFTGLFVWSIKLYKRASEL